MKRFFYYLLVPLAISVLSPIWIETLHADSGRAPISGTPMLREKKLQLLRDYGRAARIKAEREPGKTPRADTVGQTATFYVYNFGTENYYTTAATCRSVTALGTGNYLYIYVEDAEWTRKSSLFSDTILSNISLEYKNNILPNETTYFGTPPTGDFTILLLDIRDSGIDTYVAGYFDSLNELSGVANSNHRHMIYMDSNEGTPGEISFYGTFAHEFSHFIHYSYDDSEETWVEEGFAGLARYICGYGHQVSHVNAFGREPTVSLTQWFDDLASYGATYLFMLYLEEHYGGAATTKEIVANALSGIAGINNALFRRGYLVTVNDIFKNWVVANYLNNTSISSGIYGYEASFSATGITHGPGSIAVSTTISTYPASGSGTTNEYGADYIKFTSLGGTYDIFVLIPYSLTESGTQAYSYTGRLGSLILNLTDISSTQGMSGVKQGSSSPTPSVVTSLSSSNTISTTSGGSSSGEEEGGGCFIATAAYGSPLGGEVLILREFRDRYLLTNPAGKLFISIYNTISPPLAHFISRHKSLRSATRMALYPVVGLSHWSLKDPWGAGLLVTMTFLLIGLILTKGKNHGTRMNGDKKLIKSL